MTHRVFTPCVISATLYQVALCDHREGQKWWHVTSEMKLEDYGFHIFNITPSGETSCHVGRDIQGTSEKAPGVQNWGLQQRSEWARGRQPWPAAQPEALEGPWASSAQPRCSQILTRRNCDIINACGLRLLSFGVICYTAIDKYSSLIEPCGKE